MTRHEVAQNLSERQRDEGGERERKNKERSRQARGERQRDEGGEKEKEKKRREEQAGRQEEKFCGNQIGTRERNLRQQKTKSFSVSAHLRGTTEGGIGGLGRVAGEMMTAQ